MNFFSDENRNNNYKFNNNGKKATNSSTKFGCNICSRISSCFFNGYSKMRTCSKTRPCLFWSILIGIVVFIIFLIVIIAVASNKNKKKAEENHNKNNNDNDIDNDNDTGNNNKYSNGIFPLSEELNSEVMSIYDGIGNNDKGTLEQFCEYLKSKGSNLKEEQKVYLSYYWITKNIGYGEVEGLSSTDLRDPDIFFSHKQTVCTGFARLFKRLLVAMNYDEDSIKNIIGYSKGQGYKVTEKPTKVDHEWNAVKINGNWCLLDATWDIDNLDSYDNPNDNYYYLCTPPQCFVRDHLPENQTEQFLDTPLDLDQFHNLVWTNGRFCSYNNLEIIEDKSIYKGCSGKFTVKYNDDYTDNLDYFQKYLKGDSFKDIINFSPTLNTNQIDVAFNVLKSGNYNVSLPMVIDNERGLGVFIATIYIECE